MLELVHNMVENWKSNCYSATYLTMHIVVYLWDCECLDKFLRFSLEIDIFRNKQVNFSSFKTLDSFTFFGCCYVHHLNLEHWKWPIVYLNVKHGSKLKWFFYVRNEFKMTDHRRGFVVFLCVDNQCYGK